MIIRQFYEKLGSFLFALAKSDGYVHDREEKAVMNEILLILEEHPGFEKNAEVQDLLLTKLCFYNSEKDARHFSEVRQDFLKFVEHNNNHISDLSKAIALRLIRKAAGAFKGVNKQEQNLLSEIVHLLSKAAKTQPGGRV